MDAFGRYVAILASIILILLFPLQYIAQGQQELMKDMAISYSTEFIDQARQQGYITLSMYEDLLHRLNHTEEMYELTLEVAHPITGKEYSDKAVDHITDHHTKLSLVNSSLLHLSMYSDSAYTRNWNLALQPLTSEIQSLATHTHNTNCYAGHNHSARGCEYHSHSGSSSSYGGCYTVSNSSPYSYTCYTCNGGGSRPCPGGTSRDGSVYYDNGATYCSVCKNNPSATVTWTKCNTCEGTLNVRKVWHCGHLSVSNSGGSHNTISCSSCGGAGMITGISIYYSLGCGKSTGYNCGYSSNDTTTKCHEVVISIVATDQNQKVDQGKSIITTAIATYLDGHTGTVNCTSNYDVNKVGTQTVTLSYTGLVGDARTQGTRTCTVNVTVIETNIPSTLTVTPSSYEIYNGSEPTYTIRVTYTNGTSKTITSGYTKTGWSSGPGVKRLTFSYTENGKTVTSNVNITVKPNAIGIAVSPSYQEIERYQKPVFTLTVNYEDGSSKVVTDYQMNLFDSRVLGNQYPTFDYTENSRILHTESAIYVTPIKHGCSLCGNEYFLDENDIDHGCSYCESIITSIIASPSTVIISKGQPLPITVEAIFQNGDKSVVNGWYSNYDITSFGYQEIIITYQEFHTKVTVYTRSITNCSTCHKEYSLDDDGTDLGCPFCREELVCILASPREIIMTKNQALPIDVTATYKDGHTCVIDGWTTNFDADTIGTYHVTISYKSAKDIITVTVLPDDLLHCPYCGLDYSYSESPNGCPVCYETIVGIEAALRNGGSTVLLGADLDLELTLIFQDSHREKTYTGWMVEGFNCNSLGIQTISVVFQSFRTTLALEVIDILPKATCPNGHVYYMDEDGTDPGCPFCDEIGTKAHAIIYFDITYTNEILETLYAKGVYQLNKGDYITITITPKNTSIRWRLQLMFFGTSRKYKERTYVYGGEVI